jgi:hypothetical protein
MSNPGVDKVETILGGSGFRAEKMSERIGQAFFNILHINYPEIANSIRGTEYDPFHFDSVSKATRDKVAELINEAGIQ